MSIVTNILIYTHISEGAMSEVNAWCVAHDDRKQHFGELDRDNAGGSRHFASRVWAMAGNMFDYRAFVDAATGFHWTHPEHVAIIVESEDTDQVVVLTFADAVRHPYIAGQLGFLDACQACCQPRSHHLA